MDITQSRRDMNTLETGHIIIKSIGQNSPYKWAVVTGIEQSFASTSAEHRSEDGSENIRKSDREFRRVYKKAQEALENGIEPVLIPAGSSGKS
ncbi:hypothetical protein KIN20_018649 [Parelaphostrongylus tenuis]|uniref:Uncharacterized protein n=1 Tax=Parelaphostrongylus tenuis TaxID=148309 RepID=A0AAD5N3Y8_PARTN|nr:hypothetical protein KIN20_018649 [Parelaphostrongylus tenuis]